jgi:hypothetical protein
VSTLAHVFEAAGLATVAFGSIRAHLAGVAPPRGLFCDFPLGRPLGRPADPAFQHRVLAQALDLLETATGPTLAEFPESIEDDELSTLACPLPPRFDPDVHPAVDEARALRPAFDRATARYGNGAGTGRVVAADDIPAAVEAFVRVVEGTPWKQAGIPGVPARVAQDIRGYYETAALALAEHTPGAWETARWFLEATHTGRTLRGAQQHLKDAGVSRNLWFYLTPGGA